MVEPIDAFADAAKIVMKPTSETAIMTAAPVVAVRRGFRAAFSRDRLPTIPRSFVSGTPMTSASWRANNGETDEDTDEHEERADAHERDAAAAGRAEGRAASDPRARITPPMARRRKRLIGRSSATARIAAIGGTRAAWRAGIVADRIVTIEPTSNPTIDRVRPQYDTASRDLEAERVHEALEPDRQSDAGGHADRARDQADDDGLADHRSRAPAAASLRSRAGAPSPAFAAPRRSRTCCR